MSKRITVFMAFVALLGWVGPVVAHHSHAAEYDESKTVTLTGTVTKIDWTNPHARIYVDVAQPSGPAANWNVELQAVSVLVRQGWKRNSLKIGDVVTFQGIPARSGANAANARMVTAADGRKMLSGPVDEK